MIVLLLVATAGKAQTTDSVSVAGIPHKLFWENRAKGFQNKNGVIVIESGPKTDMFRDPNVTYNTDNAPKLLFKPDENFVLVVSIEHAFKSKWDGGAIVIKADSLNWIKFCFEKDYTGAKRVVSVVTRDISDDCNSIAIAANKIFYKVAKAGNVITLYCSTDRVKWLLIRHFQFNITTGLKIGFLSQSPTGENCKVTFADISYAEKKIKDPYLGE